MKSKKIMRSGVLILKILLYMIILYCILNYIINFNTYMSININIQILSISLLFI